MSSASTPEAPTSRGPLVIVLAVIGVLGIIAGILYVSGAANSIHFMDGSVYKGHHQVRAVVSFIVGIAFLAGAYIARSRPATSGSAGTAAASSTTGTSGSASGTGTASGSGTVSGS